MSITLENRILGSLYGMAAGDALGVPSSTYPIRQVRDTWGWIDTFYPPAKGHIFHDGRKAGEYTDDTEQALKAIRAGADLRTSGLYGNTNGSAMRISPVGMIHGIRRSDLSDLVKDVFLTCMPTHNTDVCVSAASAIARGVAVCMMGETDLDPIVEETILAAEAGRAYGNRLCAPSIGKRIAHACSLVRQADTPKQAMEDLYDLYAGMDLAADSIPVAVALFLLGKGNVKLVNEYCVNFGGDCDTNAAMAGAMAGAYSGMDTVPEEWVTVIREVNHIELSDYVTPLIELAGHWTVGDPDQICES